MRRYKRRCTVSESKKPSNDDMLAETLYNIARMALLKLKRKKHHEDELMQYAVCDMLSAIRQGKVDWGKNWSGYLYRIALYAMMKYFSRSPYNVHRRNYTLFLEDLGICL